MKKDWKLYGKWNDIPPLALDSWNGYYNNIILKDLLGDFLRILIFWKDNHEEIMYLSKASEKEIASLARKRYRKDPRHFHIVLDHYRSERVKIGKKIKSLASKKIFKAFLPRAEWLVH